MLLERLAEHRLTRLGHALQPDHQIDIEASDDDHATAHVVDTLRCAGEPVTTLGIDLGTGSVKAALVDDGGIVLASASRTYPVVAPQPGWAETDPQLWLEAARDVVAQVAAQCGERPTAVGFSGQQHGVVLCDADARPLRPAVLWADTRGVAEVASLGTTLSDEQLARLGSAPVAGFAATTLAWLVRHEPELVAQARWALQPKDWLRAALGGEIATEPSDASGTLLFDVVDGRWSPDAVEWTGIDPSLLAPVRSSTASGGTLRLDPWGDIPCALGGADTACALAGLGLGVGEGFIAVGSGAQVVRVLPAPELDPTLRTHTFATMGAPAEGWFRIGAVQSAGLALTAALGWLGADVPEANAALAQGCRDEDPIFVPYVSGERTPFMDPRLRGSWHGLSLATDRAAMLRSILEGVAQAVALSVECVLDISSSEPVPLVGGGTHDPLFRQLLADACGVPLAVMEAPNAAVVGAALTASGCTRNPVPPTRSGAVYPDPDAAARLRRRRERMVSFVEADAEESS
jgi:xylulokinase